MRRSYRHLEFAILSALVWFQQKAEFVDEDELRHLEKALKTAKTCVHVDGAVLAADFFLHVGDYESTSFCLAMPVIRSKISCDEPDKFHRKTNAERSRIQLWLNMKRFKITGESSCIPVLSRIDGYVCDEGDADCIVTQAK